MDYRLHGSTEARDIVVVAAAVNGSATLFYLMTMHGMRAANSHAAQLLKHTHPTIRAPIGVATTLALHSLLLLLLRCED